MKLPFSTEQFFKVFENYNVSIWPLQIFLYVLAFVALFSAINKSPTSATIVFVILSFFWLWMGIVYHLLYFTAINKAAYVFGTAFILQGCLFMYAGLIKQHILFRFSKNGYGITGAIFMLFALIIYPAINYFQGHVYPVSPTFGLPCPTTIFTFGLLLWTDKKIPVTLLIIPIAWSIVGCSAAFLLHIRGDIGLLVAGIVFTVLMVFKK